MLRIAAAVVFTLFLNASSCDCTTDAAIAFGSAQLEAVPDLKLELRLALIPPTKQTRLRTAIIGETTKSHSRVRWTS